MLGRSVTILGLLWFGKEGMIAALFQLHDYVDKCTGRAFIAFTQSCIVFSENPFVVLFLHCGHVDSKNLFNLQVYMPRGYLIFMTEDLTEI